MLAAASEIFASHRALCLAVAVLLARLADILSTRFATPNLRLEMNPLVRQLGWRYAWATTALCVLPYLADWGGFVAVPVIVGSLFVAASNLSRAWMMRALGEEAYLAFARAAFARSRPALVYGSIAVSSALIAAAGGLLMLFYPKPDDWADAFALGIVVYGLAIAVHRALHARQMFRALASQSL